MIKHTVIYKRVLKVWESATFTVKAPDDATEDQIDEIIEDYVQDEDPDMKETCSEISDCSWTRQAAV
jgi:hypothetical protein